MFLFFLGPCGQVFRLEFGRKVLASGVYLNEVLVSSFFFGSSWPGFKLKFGRKGLASGVYLKEVLVSSFFWLLVARCLDCNSRGGG